MVVKSMHDQIKRCVKYCIKHDWTIYLVGIILGIVIGILLTPFRPVIDNFIDNMISFISNIGTVFFVLLVMAIGGLIKIIAKFF